MAKNHSPAFKRQVVAEFNSLANDLLKGEAERVICERHGVSAESIRSWRRKFEGAHPIPVYSPRIERLSSSDFEITLPVPETAKTVTIVPQGRLLEFVASDIHFPYEDKAAYQLFLDVVTDLQPDVVVLLGDIMDCYAVSAHDKDANRATPAHFKNELIYTRQKLEELRRLLPNARIIYKEGNHETRLSRYIQKNAAVLSNLKCITLPELLDLASLGIEWIANDERLRIGKMWHIHGNEVGGGGESPARLKYKRMNCNFIFGHLHCRDKHRPRAYDGSQHGAYANPCLCDLNPEYMHHTHNWSNGFTGIDHDADMTFQVDEIEIMKVGQEAKCNVRGKIYTVNG